MAQHAGLRDAFQLLPFERRKRRSARRAILEEIGRRSGTSTSAAVPDDRSSRPTARTQSRSPVTSRTPGRWNLGNYALSAPGPRTRESRAPAAPRCAPQAGDHSRERLRAPLSSRVPPGAGPRNRPPPPQSPPEAFGAPPLATPRPDSGASPRLPFPLDKSPAMRYPVPRAYPPFEACRAASFSELNISRGYAHFFSYTTFGYISQSAWRNLQRKQRSSSPQSGQS